MPRDALWVLPSGATTVVTVDDDGNLIEPIADAAPELATAPTSEPQRAAPPPPRHKRGRHSRH